MIPFAKIERPLTGSFNLPLPTFYTRDVSVALPMFRPTRLQNLFCECSGSEVLTLFENRNDLLNDETVSQRNKDLLAMLDDDMNIQPLENMGPEGKECLERCVDFLKFKNEMEVGTTIESIQDFVEEFLEMEEHYDYWLMNMLEWFDIMEHGTSIRCGWWNRSDKNKYADWVVTDPHHQDIIRWLSRNDLINK